MNQAAAAAAAYKVEVDLLAGYLETAAIAQQSAANTVAAQVKSITDEITAHQAEKIALEEGAVAALNYRIASAICRKHLHRWVGRNTSPSSRISRRQLAAGTGNQQALNEALDKAKASYANAQREAANLADQLRLVAEYQERLTHQQAALEASFQYIPDAEAAARTMRSSSKD